MEEKLGEPWKACFLPNLPPRPTQGTRGHTS